jgi:hypothetical protein
MNKTQSNYSKNLIGDLITCGAPDASRTAEMMQREFPQRKTEETISPLPVAQNIQLAANTSWQI